MKKNPELHALISQLMKYPSTSQNDPNKNLCGIGNMRTITTRKILTLEGKKKTLQNEALLTLNLRDTV